jgi:hypothetical protein
MDIDCSEVLEKQGNSEKENPVLARSEETVDVDVIVSRWQSLAGKKATLDGDGRSCFEEMAASRKGGAAIISRV